jgi:hypothetical protein
LPAKYISRPPTTSAQVLFPDRYQAREAAVDLPDPAVAAALAA